MSNPFKPGSGLYPPYFAGREREIDIFSKKLSQTMSGTPMHMSIIGDWATGKTSLIRKFRDVATKEDCFVSELISPATGSVDDFVNTLTDNLIDEIKRTKGNKTYEKIKESISNLDGLGVSAFGFGASIQKSKPRGMSPQFALRVTFRSIWEIVKKDQKAIVLIIDDFDLMSEDPGVMKDILLTLRNSLMEAINDEVKIMCVVTGAKLFGDVKAVHGPFVRFFEPFELGNLEFEQAKEAIKNPLQKTKVRYSKEVIEKIIRLTDGHPYYIQEFCYMLYENSVNDRVDNTIFDAVYHKIINDLARKMWNQRMYELGDSSFKVLHLITVGNNTTESIISKGKETFKLKSTTTRSILTRLQQLGLIIRVSRGEYKISDKLMGEYISTLFK